jgi:hypothetical protein
MKESPIRKEYFGEPKSFDELRAEEYFRRLPKKDGLVTLEVPTRRNDLEFLSLPKKKAEK